MPELSAAPSINDTRTQALLGLISRLAALDLTTILVYRIDSVVDGALPFLAWQFDVLSPLWQLIAPVALGVDALTNIDLLIDVDNLIESGGLLTEVALSEAAQRELLKSAIGCIGFAARRGRSSRRSRRLDGSRSFCSRVRRAGAECPILRTRAGRYFAS
jgi:hypothetical protein